MNGTCATVKRVTYAVSRMVPKLFLKLRSSDGGQRPVWFFWRPSCSEYFAVVPVSPFLNAGNWTNTAEVSHLLMRGSRMLASIFPSLFCGTKSSWPLSGMITIYILSSSTLGLLEKLVKHCFVIFLLCFRKWDLVGVCVSNKHPLSHPTYRI